MWSRWQAARGGGDEDNIDSPVGRCSTPESVGHCQWARSSTRRPGDTTRAVQEIPVDLITVGGVGGRRRDPGQQRVRGTHTSEGPPARNMHATHRGTPGVRRVTVRRTGPGNYFRFSVASRCSTRSATASRYGSRSHPGLRVRRVRSVPGDRLGDPVGDFELPAGADGLIGVGQRVRHRVSSKSKPTSAARTRAARARTSPRNGRDQRGDPRIPPMDPPEGDRADAGRRPTAGPGRPDVGAVPMSSSQAAAISIGRSLLWTVPAEPGGPASHSLGMSHRSGRFRRNRARARSRASLTSASPVLPISGAQQPNPGAAPANRGRGPRPSADQSERTRPTITGRPGATGCSRPRAGSTTHRHSAADSSGGCPVPDTAATPISPSCVR